MHQSDPWTEGTISSGQSCWEKTAKVYWMMLTKHDPNWLWILQKSNDTFLDPQNVSFDFWRIHSHLDRASSRSSSRLLLSKKTALATWNHPSVEGSLWCIQILVRNLQPRRSESMTLAYKLPRICPSAKVLKELQTSTTARSVKAVLPSSDGAFRDIGVSWCEDFLMPMACPTGETWLSLTCLKKGCMPYCDAAKWPLLELFES